MQLNIQQFFSGNNAESLMHYEKAIKMEQLGEVDKESPTIRNHIRQCRAGIARTSIKNGDHRKGVSSPIPTSHELPYFHPEFLSR